MHRILDLDRIADVGATYVTFQQPLFGASIAQPVTVGLDEAGNFEVWFAQTDERTTYAHDEDVYERLGYLAAAPRWHDQESLPGFGYAAGMLDEHSVSDHGYWVIELHNDYPYPDAPTLALDFPTLAAARAWASGEGHCTPRLSPNGMAVTIPRFVHYAPPHCR